MRLNTTKVECKLDLLGRVHCMVMGYSHGMGFANSHKKTIFTSYNKRMEVL